MACYLIDNKDALEVFVSEIQGISNDPPSFYIDAEGSNLGRFGTMDLLQVHVLPLHETFIVDVFTLGHAAFDTIFQGNSLRMLLQSPSIPKVIFDVRNDSDAMFHHYNIALSGVVDLQMMEYFQENRSSRNLASLRHCIEHDATLSPEEIRRWSEVKASVLHPRRDNADPKNLPSQRRPLDENLIFYAAGDVEHLPLLHRAYCQRLTEEGWQAVHIETGRRLRRSMQPSYDTESKQKGKGPYRILGPRGYKHLKAKASTPQHNANKQKAKNHFKPKESSSKATGAQKPDRNVGRNDMNSIGAPLHGLLLTGGPSGTSAQAQEVSPIAIGSIVGQLTSRKKTTMTPLRHRPTAFVKDGHAQQGGRKKRNKSRQWNRSSGANPQQTHENLLDDLDWTLCDKDCGWCGRCYNGFDFDI
ncbi:uncharacterized protein A1O5_05276 [Cladophialophora psammophila CBS 110553]|uniref:3'-5' exonuclease domain-containing protein n=1 Tax=Cladophialophora psammophila CBS 110553 TaxID=1182543 RepID=W9WU55_9EURO|nr:uncharacterized protein A1O5_05276 [Cladophialophora psammophila CBS 110553]EXJ71468.1 hypothetical protein A1O5_05276 [Cladophialophora psammophila CBS 110553]